MRLGRATRQFPTLGYLAHMHLFAPELRLNDLL